MTQAPNGYRYFHAVAMVFICMLMISNTIAVKIVQIGSFTLAAGIICFPITYIFGDVLTEVYGYQKTRSVIWWGFACLAFMAGFYYLATLLTPAPFWKNQDAFAKLFGLVPRITLAFFVAFLFGSFVNSYIMSRMKVWMKGKHLWMRTIGSTIFGEGIDSLLFHFIAFYGIFDGQHILFTAFSGFVLKTLYEVIATPLTYAVVGWLKRVESEDKYDVGISYNPFIAS